MKDEAATDTLYTISQAGALTGVPRSTIRFWEREFARFLVPGRSAGNQRRYDDKAIKVIKLIDRLVNREGYTLDGARRKLQELHLQRELASDDAESRLGELAESMSDLLFRRLMKRIRSEQVAIQELR